MKIITVSREFGSGGRELGRRLADEFGFAYYDREIVSAVAESMSMDENYLNNILRRGVSRQIPVTFSKTLSGRVSQSVQDSYILAREHSIIKEIGAAGDCVIVGRGADALLKQYQPFSVFVYADMDSRIARCKSRAADEEQRSDKEWTRLIKSVDKIRERNYELISQTKWGDMHSYRLCVNSTDIKIADIIPSISEYVRAWFEKNTERIDK